MGRIDCRQSRRYDQQKVFHGTTGRWGGGGALAAMISSFTGLLADEPK
jgi:hypothetical protein